LRPGGNAITGTVIDIWRTAHKASTTHYFLIDRGQRNLEELPFTPPANDRGTFKCLKEALWHVGRKGVPPNDRNVGERLTIPGDPACQGHSQRETPLRNGNT